MKAPIHSRRTLGRFLTALLMMVVFSCHRDTEETAASSEAIAWVNGQPIPKLRLIQSVTESGFRTLKEIESALKDPKYVSQIVALLVTEEMLFQEARKLGLKAKPLPTPEKAEKLAASERRGLIAALVEREVNAKIKLPENEINSYYHSRIDQFRKPPVVRARQILVARREEALEILQHLRSGMDFASEARERSKSPDAERGGDLGYFSADEIQPEIAEACFDLPIGGISREIETPYGFHILQVIDKVAAKTLTLEEARPAIETELRKQKRELAYQTYLSELRSRSKIKLAS